MSNLEVVWVAVGEGRPVHVAVGDGTTWIHGVVNIGESNLVMTADQAAAWVRGYSWFEIPFPVLDTGAVLGTEGAAASNCVTGACQAILNGWTSIFP